MTDQAARLSNALSGRYRIDRELGAGGMATVYLAEDLKHDRKVAVKVLKPELAVAIGAERFLAEIKTTANLQHPHILALHDSGEVSGTVFYVMPFVEGESLRDRLDREKQLPIDDALRIAGEVADALQYAHERGVIHRDIKPENILLQRGHAVVADFGIALAASKSGGSRMTETGMSLGTPTYMSPEQAMGAREVDARTDIYSLGCVVYEMLAGEPPFVGPTAQSIVAKVMTESPRGLSAQRHTVPEHVDAAVRTALEKLAADRFATAAAFAFGLRDTSASPRHSSGSTRREVAALSRGARALRWGAATLIGATALAGMYVLGRGSTASASSADAVIIQRTFRTSPIFVARYTSNGDAFVYSAADIGSTPRIFTVGTAFPEPRAVSDTGTHLLAVSSKDEMAVLVHTKFEHHAVFTGTLARMPVGGGAPRELLTNVTDADWSPDGAQLAVVHDVAGKSRLEYPIGTTLYESPGQLSSVRVAPDGQRVAFLEHPERGDDRGFVALIDRSRKRVQLTSQVGANAIEGLAWTRDGERLVYSATLTAGDLQLHEITVGGVRLRRLPNTGSVTMHDIAPDGRWLVTRDDQLRRTFARGPGRNAETDISFIGGAIGPLMSGDGRQVAFSDVSSFAGDLYSTMMRSSEGSAAIRLGEGFLLAMSRDKQWVLSSVPSAPVKLMLHPTGAGTSRRLDHGELESITDADFLGDGSQIVVCGNEPKHALRCYVRPTADGAVAATALRPITGDGVRYAIGSPDGQTVIGSLANGEYRRYVLRDGSSRAVAGMMANDELLRFSPDGRAIWIRRLGEQPARIEQVELATGARTPLGVTFAPPRRGTLRAGFVTLADDPHFYAYSQTESASDVFEFRWGKPSAR
jgi:serine/threonine protein kinase/Tol biopolymer transport system component